MEAGSHTAGSDWWCFGENRTLSVSAGARTTCSMVDECRPRRYARWRRSRQRVAFETVPTRARNMRPRPAFTAYITQQLTTVSGEYLTDM